MSKINKSRYWVGVLYPENMIDNWEFDIGDIIQVPYAYCKHYKDTDTKSEHRKDHVHLILVFSNTTTYNHAFNIFNLLSADGKQALNTIQAVVNIRSMYDYLIHNTETCKRKGKELYKASERICGNNFDIGSYEQLSIAEKNNMCKELCDIIIENGFINFADFYVYVISEFDESYFDILKSYSGFFERLTKANYQKYISFSE